MNHEFYELYELFKDNFTEKFGYLNNQNLLNKKSYLLIKKELQIVLFYYLNKILPECIISAN